MVAPLETTLREILCALTEREIAQARVGLKKKIMRHALRELKAAEESLDRKCGTARILLDQIDAERAATADLTRRREAEAEERIAAARLLTDAYV